MKGTSSSRKNMCFEYLSPLFLGLGWVQSLLVSRTCVFLPLMNCNAHGTKAMQCYQPGHLAEALHQICNSRRGSDFDRFTKRHKDITSINLLNLVGLEGTVFLRATKQNWRYL